MKTTTKVADQKTDPSMEDILSSIRDIISGDGGSAKSESQPGPDQPSSVPPSDDQEVLDLIHMLREDNSVELVSPYGSPQTDDVSAPIVAAAKKKPAADKETPDTVEEIAEDVEEEGAEKKSAPPKKKLSKSEEDALESIAQTLSEMDQHDPSETARSLEVEAMDKLTETMDDLAAGIEENVLSGADDDPLLSEEALSEAADALDVLNELSGTASTKVALDQVGGKTVDALMKEILRPLLKDWLDANLPSMVRTIVNEQVEKVIQQKSQLNQSARARKAS